MPADELSLLASGDITVIGRVVDSSNATLLVEVARDDAKAMAIYKPQAGERPLWDFDPGLYRREVAAYLLCRELGLDFVPPTLVREDAPAGVGSLQLFIDADFSEHYFTIEPTRPETHDLLRAIAAFDVLANNTDRKSGHILCDRDGKLWGIDHGLCFAAEFKLRTVIWDFQGEPIDPDLVEAIRPLATEIPDAIADLLTVAETHALRERAHQLVADPVLPQDPTGYQLPWPLV